MVVGGMHLCGQEAKLCMTLQRRSRSAGEHSIQSYIFVRTLICENSKAGKMLTPLQTLQVQSAKPSLHFYMKCMKLLCIAKPAAVDQKLAKLPANFHLQLYTQMLKGVGVFAIKDKRVATRAGDCHSCLATEPQRSAELREHMDSVSCVAA